MAGADMSATDFAAASAVAHGVHLARRQNEFNARLAEVRQDLEGRTLDTLTDVRVAATDSRKARLGRMLSYSEIVELRAIAMELWNEQTHAIRREMGGACFSITDAGAEALAQSDDQ